MDFFVAHSWLLLFVLAFFPRIGTFCMMVFGTLISGGVLWWLGWIFAPHLLVAFLSLPYWETNPVLVIFAWIFALTGTSAECQCSRSARRRR